MLAEVVLSSSPSSQLAAGFPRCHARPSMRDSNEIMPALVFKYENAHIEFLITHTIELKLLRDYSKWAGWIDSAPVSGYVPTVPGTVGDWENCMAQSYVPVRNSDPLIQSETSENSLG